MTTPSSADPYNLQTPRPTPQSAIPEQPADPSAEQAAQDDAPALASVAPQFEQDNPEGVDMSTMPPFKDLSTMLPAHRIAGQMKLAKVAKGIPGATDGKVTANFDDMTVEELDAMTTLFTECQDLVISQAQSPNDMADWLMVQKDGMQALFAAFGRYTDLVKN